MSDFYTDLRDEDVIPLIAELGQTVTLERTADTSVWERRYDASTGGYYWYNTSTGATTTTDPSGTVVTYSGKGVVVDYKDDVIDNTLIKVGDKRLLTITLPSPLIGDKITVNSVTYNYVSHNTVSPGATDVLYKIQLRV